MSRVVVKIKPNKVGKMVIEYPNRVKVPEIMVPVPRYQVELWRCGDE